MVKIKNAYSGLHEAIGLFNRFSHSEKVDIFRVTWSNVMDIESVDEVWLSDCQYCMVDEEQMLFFSPIYEENDRRRRKSVER